MTICPKLSFGLLFDVVRFISKLLKRKITTMNTYEEENLSMDAPGVLPVSMLSTEKRAAFLKKTYGHVALAFLAFVGVETLLFVSGLAEGILNIVMTGRFAWIILIFGSMYGLRAVDKWAINQSSKGPQYLALGAAVLVYSILFVPLLTMVMIYSGSNAFTGVLLPSLFITTGLFAGLVLTVFITGKDFSFLRAAISMGSMAAIGLIVVSALFGFQLGTWFIIAMIVLMIGSILYQTSQMVHVYHEKQYVIASVGVFTSFMTLLYYIISLVSSRN